MAEIQPTAANGEVAPKAAVPPGRKNQAVFYEVDFRVLTRVGFLWRHPLHEPVSDRRSGYD